MSGFDWRRPLRPLLPLRPPQWFGAVLALVGAALLVVFLQRQYATEQQQQNYVISQEICERTAALLAGRLRRQFEGAILETIESLDHMALAEWHLAEIVPALDVGMQMHPYVERFFMWSHQGPQIGRDQVLFFRPSREAGAVPRHDSSDDGEIRAVFSDPEPGRDIFTLSRLPERRRRTFMLEERTYRGAPYQVLIHLIHRYDASMPEHDIIAIIGYTVNLEHVQRQMFELLADEVALLTPPRNRSPQLSFSVRNAAHQIIHGPLVPAGVPSASTPLALSFFPAEGSTTWVADNVHPQTWQLVVSAAPPPDTWTTRDYLFPAALLLICIALMCAVALSRQSTQLAVMHSDFVAHVSHQLKTPLAVLSAAAETLQSERLRSPDKVREYAGIVHSQTGRLSSLVEQILLFSRGTGEHAYRLAPTAIEPVVRASVDRLGADSSRIIVRDDLLRPPGEGLCVVADPAMLEEAFVNLLDNALKYTADGADVMVTVARVGDQAWVAVRDRGIGIKPEDLPHIFDKFYRGRHVGRRTRGFGLGLSIVQNVVHAHRGQIRVTSTPGDGAEFTVALPLC